MPEPTTYRKLVAERLLKIPEIQRYALCVNELEAWMVDKACSIEQFELHKFITMAMAWRPNVAYADLASDSKVLIDQTFAYSETRGELNALRSMVSMTADPEVSDAAIVALDIRITRQLSRLWDIALYSLSGSLGPEPKAEWAAAFNSAGVDYVRATALHNIGKILADMAELHAVLTAQYQLELEAAEFAEAEFAADNG